MDNIKNKKILTYKDVKYTKIGVSNEALVSVNKYDSKIIVGRDDEETSLYIGDEILVRDQVAKKLAIVNGKLKNGMRLKIACGFRHPEVQKRCFLKERLNISKNNPGLSDDEIDELTHSLIAVPDVAGHIVGGAVDVTIFDKNNQPLDMGTEIAEFDKADMIATYSKDLTDEQVNNRGLLHDLMVEEGFAPFYGEWWHFSYGDREWAAFYGYESAIYGECALS